MCCVQLTEVCTRGRLGLPWLPSVPSFFLFFWSVLNANYTHLKVRWSGRDFHKRWGRCLLQTGLAACCSEPSPSLPGNSQWGPGAGMLTKGTSGDLWPLTMSFCYVLTAVNIGEEQLHLQFDLAFRQKPIHLLKTPIKINNGLSAKPEEVLSKQTQVCCASSAPLSFSFLNFLKHTGKPPTKHRPPHLLLSTDHQVCIH